LEPMNPAPPVTRIVSTACISCVVTWKLHYRAFERILSVATEATEQVL
jgi:hypothetical protein